MFQKVPVVLRKFSDVYRAVILSHAAEIESHMKDRTEFDLDFMGTLVLCKYVSNSALSGYSYSNI